MNDFCIGLYTKAISVKNGLRRAIRSEKGVSNIIAIVIILAIVVSLALIFKDKIAKLFGDIFPEVSDNQFDITESDIT